MGSKLIVEPEAQIEIYDAIDWYESKQTGLGEEFYNYLKGLNVKKVHIAIGTCKMCYTGEKVYEFYKNPKIGKPAFAYNIQEREGNIKDIFRCNYSDGYQRDARKGMGSNITFIDI